MGRRAVGTDALPPSLLWLSHFFLELPPAENKPCPQLLSLDGTRRPGGPQPHLRCLLQGHIRSYFLSDEGLQAAPEKTRHLDGQGSN